MHPEELEALAMRNLEAAQKIVDSGNYNLNTEAQIHATIGAGYATLAASAWRVWIAENRQPIEPR